MVELNDLRSFTNLNDSILFQKENPAMSTELQKGLISKQGVVILLLCS